MTNRLIILAGGISSRMKNSVEDISIDKKLIEDADKKSKSMIRLGDSGRPFLDYLLYNASKSDITDVVIVIGERDDSIKRFYEEKYSDNFLGLNLSYAVQTIPQGREKPMGTADALFVGMLSVPDWIGKSFIMCNSDNLYSINSIKKLLNSPYPNAMIDYDIDGLLFEKDRIGKFAVTKKDKQDFLIDIIEKPQLDEIEALKKKDGYVGVSMNIFKFDYEMIFPFLEKVPINPIRNEKEIPTAVKMMIKENSKSMFAHRMKEYVPDLSSKKDISLVKDFLAKEFSNTKFD